MTYSRFLESNGWQSFNLFETCIDLKSKVIWAHITNPHQRHTKGVAQYLYQNTDIDIDDPSVSKMIVSAVFDEHTYSLNMMLGPIWNYNINWIPLDAEITKWNQYPTPIQQLNGDDLTNNWFASQNLQIRISKNDRLNVADEKKIKLYKKINQLKLQYSQNYAKIVKNFLEPDCLIYDLTVDKFRKMYLTN
jgi:hypothetical protein